MAQCAWREGCSEPNVGRSSLCEEHLAIAKELRQKKLAGWEATRIERDTRNLELASAIMTAEKDALFTIASSGEFEAGTKKVVIVHAKTRSALANYLLGRNKGGVAQPQWAEMGGKPVKFTAEGMSMATAKAYADEFNTRLADLGVEDTVSIVV